MYIDKAVENGYNPYLFVGDDANTGMDVGLLVLSGGEHYTLLLPEQEIALLLLEGNVCFEWADQAKEAERADCFHHDPWCLHVPRNTRVKVVACSHAEIYLQAALNPRDFPAKLYAPEDTQIQHAGAADELKGSMRREIKTIFDYDNAPYSTMVLGEVLNYPGKWSSYPPHHHPQPEVYFHRFDKPQGFGASFANGEVYASHHNGLTVINEGFHSQTAAPGYAMCYVWGIRHLPNDPWKKTRIDDAEHAWLLKADANDHILSPEGE